MKRPRLISCMECGRSGVSPSADTCPKCGKNPQPQICLRCKKSFPKSHIQRGFCAPCSNDKEIAKKRNEEVKRSARDFYERRMAYRKVQRPTVNCTCKCCRSTFISVNPKQPCPQCGNPFSSYKCSVCDDILTGHPARIYDYSKYTEQCTKNVHGIEYWKKSASFVALSCDFCADQLEEWVFADIATAERHTQGLRHSYPRELLGCLGILFVLFLLYLFTQISGGHIRP